MFGVSSTKRGFNRIQKVLNIFPMQDWAAFYGEVRSQGCVIPASQKAVVSGFQQNITLCLTEDKLYGVLVKWPRKGYPNKDVVLSCQIRVCFSVSLICSDFNRAACFVSQCFTIFGCRTWHPTTLTKLFMERKRFLQDWSSPDTLIVKWYLSVTF